MGQLNLFKSKELNINQIKAEPIFKREKFADYKINIQDAVNESEIKNWIENHNDHKELKNRIINNPNKAHIRIKHDEKGNVKEIYLKDYGGGYLCCMNYKNKSSWPRLFEMIKGADQDDNGRADREKTASNI
jgi:hypothetical protein